MRTFLDLSASKMDGVSSVEPSLTTMISFRGQVCASAECNVSAIVSCALKAGIRIETRGFMMYSRPIVLHKRFGSIQQPPSTNAVRMRNPVSAAAAGADAETDHSQNRFQSPSSDPPDHKAGTGIQFRPR